MASELTAKGEIIGRNRAAAARTTQTVGQAMANELTKGEIIERNRAAARMDAALARVTDEQMLATLLRPAVRRGGGW